MLQDKAGDRQANHISRTGSPFQTVMGVFMYASMLDAFSAEEMPENMI